MPFASRRRFLQSASAASALYVITPRLGFALTPPPTGSAQGWATYQDKRHDTLQPLAWKPVTAFAPDAIVLDPSTLKQEILGFGAAFTDASCYVLSQMPSEKRAALLHELFAPDQMALNVCRTTIGASDYSRNAYTYDDSDTPDPQLTRFSIDHDKAYILPILREARAIHPELFLFSSPWSPPGWMKTSNTILGGAMQTTYYASYANYFLHFLNDYKAAGIQINAVTVQNEADNNQDGRMPQCEWGQQYEIEFVRDHLGPTLQKAGLATKIWVIDHNYDLWGRALDELSDAGAYPFIDGIAWHGYNGHPSSMSRVHEQFPAKNAYWTEGGPDFLQKDLETDWAHWGDTFNGILNNWSRSITAWNLALDEKGNPNIGPFRCAGVVTVENGTHKVIRSGQYWAFAHFSRHIQRGARVIASTDMGIPPDAPPTHAQQLSHSAFRNPDGTFVAVIANRGPQRSVQLVHDALALEFTAPPNSLMTFAWT